MRKKAGGGLNLHVGLELCHIQKVLVARDIEPDKLVDRSGIDLVDHPQGSWVIFSLDVDFRIEVAAGLQIVQKIPLTLVKKVLVEGVFLKDRHLLLQNPVTHAVAAGENHDSRARIDLEGVVDGVRLRAVLLLRNQNLGQHPLLLLELLTQPLQRIVNSRGSYTVAVIHVSDTLHLARRQPGSAGDLHLAHMCRFSGREVNDDIDLLRGRIGCTFRRHPGAVVAVFLHQLADILQRTLEFLAAVRFSQFELGGVDDLVCVGAARRALGFDGTDEEVEPGDEGEDNSVARGSDLRLDVGETTSGIQDANALANLIASQWLSGL